MSRTAIAAAVSLGLHLLIWFFAQPAYREVRDIAITMEILDGERGQLEAPDAAGPRDVSQPEAPVVPEAPPPPAGQIVDEPPPVSTKPEKETDGLKSDSETEEMQPAVADTGDSSGTDRDSDENTDTDTAESVSEDTAVARIDTEQAGHGSDTETDTDTILMARAGGDATAPVASGTDDAGGGGTDSEEEGICLHDVFAWSNDNPTWMLWLAMDAFAGTAYDSGLAGVLGSFYLYNEMVRATGIKPLTELESVLISADSFSDFSTYQVVTTFNVSQEVLVDRLKRNHAGNKNFTLKKTSQGVSGVLPGKYRWDFVGSGRVMVASDAAKGKFNRNWPSSVSCMAPRPPFEGDGQEAFGRLVRSQIGPSAEGRWPVLLIATRDADAVGMGRHPAMAEAFQWAWVKGYFSNPPRLEGVVQFSPAMKDMDAVRRTVKSILKQASAARLVGLGEVPGRVQWEVKDNRLEFAVPLTEPEVRIMLMLLRSYSAQLNRMFSRGATSNTAP